MKIKDDLTDNTRKLIDNQTNLDGLHQKTVSLKGTLNLSQKTQLCSSKAQLQSKGRCGGEIASLQL